MRSTHSLNSIYLAPSASPSVSPSLANGFNNKLNLNHKRFSSTKSSKPVAEYPNADLLKNTILKENDKKSGIYL